MNFCPRVVSRFVLSAFLLSVAYGNEASQNEEVNNLRQRMLQEPISRVVGGEHAQASSFPWYAFITDFMNFSSGSLVYEDIVLTSASGLRDSFSSLYITNACISFSCLLGSTPPHTIEQISIHPSYDSSNNQSPFDFALIKLGTPSSVQPIELNSDSSVPVDGTPLTAMGYGAVFPPNSFPAVMMKLDQPVISSSVCSGSWGFTVDGENTICAGEEQGRGLCIGDSGAPFVDETGVQIGVASSFTCGNGTKPDLLGRVSSVRTWINEQICDLSSNPPDSCFTSEPSTGPATPSPTMAPTSQEVALFQLIEELVDILMRVVNALPRIIAIMGNLVGGGN